MIEIFLSKSHGDSVEGKDCATAVKAFNETCPKPLPKPLLNPLANQEQEQEQEQKQDQDIQTPVHVSFEPNPDKLPEQVAEIFRLHPRNSGLVTAGKPASAGQERIIAEAIMQDGFELVMAGTKNLRDAFVNRPHDDLRFCPSPEKFFQPGSSGNYLSDPHIWKGQTIKLDPIRKVTADFIPAINPTERMRRELAND
ncbi:MAG: hypothetical protein CXZ00_05975 [Acidobacteria bacterium]|nr:MAG: hypothetical protein CXZ00_05975 [Acidobacteriota bacterium]